MTIVLTPQPVNCRNCCAVLHASDAAANFGLCPGCGAPVCYTCGCGEGTACVRESRRRDGSRAVTVACAWWDIGLCSFCFDEVSDVLYLEATGRVPADEFYLRTYRPGAMHTLALAGVIDC